MADITKDDVIEFIANMSVLELSELVKEMEEKFGVSAAAPVAMMAGGMPAEAAAAAVEEQTEFDVILVVFGRQEDQGDQGSSRHYRSRPERRQGPGGRGAQARERRRCQRTRPIRSRPNLKRPAPRSNLSNQSTPSSFHIIICLHQRQWDEIHGYGVSSHCRRCPNTQ